MKTIHRYPIDIRKDVGGVVTLHLPVSAQILHVGVRPADGVPSLWALIDEDDTQLDWEVWIRIVGTGHALPDSACGHHYLGTFNVGPLVFHALRTYERNAAD